jgi:uncharacterized protein
MIALYKLNNGNKVELDEDINFPESYFNEEVRGLKDAHVNGVVYINDFDEVEVSLEVNGTFILPCAVSLEDVDYEFSVEIDENAGNYEKFLSKEQNSLDISDIIWENIISEVPLRVVKEGAKPIVTSGDGWKLEND